MSLIRAEMIEKNPFSEIGVILCGDFNSTPPFGVLQYCLGRLEVEMLILYLSGDLFNSYKLAQQSKAINMLVVMNFSRIN